VDVGEGVVAGVLLTAVVEVALLDVETGFMEPLLCLVELPEEDQLLEVVKQLVWPAKLCRMVKRKKSQTTYRCRW
jgi:uncharacterized membrane protein YagU involved in acid resistance